MLNQNLIDKRDEFKWKLCYFDVLVRFVISKNSEIVNCQWNFENMA